MSERITWHVDVPPNTTVHVESFSQATETRMEPVTKHDGKLDEYDDYKVTFDGKQVAVTDGYDAHVYLDPKQALSLLAWLLQEEDKLKKLAKEQAE